MRDPYIFHSVAELLGELPSRVAKGEDTWTAKLSERDVLAIRARYVELPIVTMAELADAYEVSTVAIYKILHRLTWKHI